MIVVISDEAEADLLRIAAYLAEKSPLAAARLIKDLRIQCERLADFPSRYPLLPTYEKSGIRRCVLGDYLIFYIVTAEAGGVLHILHGAMDYEPILFPKS